jgi:hypothetical protein
MTEKPLKTLVCSEKELELYSDRLVLHPKGGLLRRVEADQMVIPLRDIVQITHLEEPSFRAGCYNLLIKQADGKLTVLPYQKKYQYIAKQIYEFVRQAVSAAAA